MITSACEELDFYGDLDLSRGRMGYLYTDSVPTIHVPGEVLKSTPKICACRRRGEGLLEKETTNAHVKI